MTKSRLVHDWTLNATIRATLINLHRKAGSSPVQVRQLLPPPLRPPVVELSPSEFLEQRTKCE
jgi:hypothetical protein